MSALGGSAVRWCRQSQADHSISNARSYLTTNINLASSPMVASATAPFVPPEFNENRFNCPQCQTFAVQVWSDLAWVPGKAYNHINGGWRTAMCQYCGKHSMWLDGKMVYPLESTAPPPNPDLPQTIKEDYEEARAILQSSPRGAAALLRLAIQKLMKEVGEEGKNINADIAALVQKGLPSLVQQALDLVRVIGNESVHPGQIDLRDDPDTARSLFGLVNIIADVLISQPKHIAALYNNTLPQSKRDGIVQRDGPKQV